jgi:hypothetical protein
MVDTAHMLAEMKDQSDDCDTIIRLCKKLGFYVQHDIVARHKKLKQVRHTMKLVLEDNRNLGYNEFVEKMKAEIEECKSGKVDPTPYYNVDALKLVIYVLEQMFPQKKNPPADGTGAKMMALWLKSGPSTDDVKEVIKAMRDHDPTAFA